MRLLMMSFMKFQWEFGGMRETIWNVGSEWWKVWKTFLNLGKKIKVIWYFDEFKT